MSPARCNPIWPLCIHEIHAILVGLLVGILATILLRRSGTAATAFLTVVVILSWVAPVHGILKPWYVLGGTVAGMTISRLTLTLKRTHLTIKSGQN